MQMKSPLASLLVLFATSGPLLSATELERLRALCAEQELQIYQLETRISQLTDTPPPAKKEAIASAAPSQEPAAQNDPSYVVKPGDSLERIANRYKLTVPVLAGLNGLKPEAIIHPGQKLKVGTNTESASAPSAAPSKARVHTIQTGDTLFKISRKYGVSLDELMSANPGINAKALRVGDTINISTPAQEPETSVAKAPAPSLASEPAQPISNTPAKVKETPRTSNQPVKINTEITYDEFARNYKTTTDRLDELNGLKLDPNTVLAQGSELYIPAQP